MIDLVNISSASKRIEFFIMIYFVYKFHLIINMEYINGK